MSRLRNRIMQYLETERLILRPWDESDAEECFRYAKDPRVGPAAGWPPHKDIEESKKIIKTILSAPETYAIVFKETGKAVGSIGLMAGTELAKQANERELGYWIGVPFWGKGLVPEAVRAILSHAFLDMGFEKVYCGYYNGNDRSRRVQEKCGFRYLWTCDEVDVPQMGEKRKGHVSCLTRAQWEDMRKEKN